MGWWDTWDKVKNWSVRAWRSATADNIKQFSYKTALTVLGLPQAALRASSSVIWHPNIRRIGINVGRIAIESSIPIALSYVNNEIQSRGREYLDDEPNDEWLSVDTFIITSLVLLNSSLWIFQKRQKLATLAHVGILNLEASNAVAHRLPETKICQDCTTMRFMKGSFRDLLTYWSTELLIEGLRFIPVVGEGVATGLSIYHNGRYVATLLWSPYCGRHLDENLREYPEFALAQGLSHAGTSWLVSYLVELGTGVPRTYYESTVQQLALVGQVIVAAHSDLPVPVKQSQRLVIDPVGCYEGVVKFSIDVVLSGLKKELPPRAKVVIRPLLNMLPQTPTIPWDKVGQVVVIIWSNPVSGVIKFCVLPSILQGQKQFVNDPLVSHNWRGLRDKTVGAIIDMEVVSKKYAIRMVSTVPEATGEAVQVVMGTPKILTEIILRILRNHAFMDFLAQKRRVLEGIHSGPSPRIESNPSATPMRGQLAETSRIIRPTIIEEVDEQPQAKETAQEIIISHKIPTESQIERKFSTSSERQIKSEDRSEARLEEKILKRFSLRSTGEDRLEAKTRKRHSFFKTEDPKVKSAAVMSESVTRNDQGQSLRAEEKEGWEEEFVYLNKDSSQQSSYPV